MRNILAKLGRINQMIERVGGQSLRILSDMIQWNVRERANTFTSADPLILDEAADYYGDYLTMP